MKRANDQLTLICIETEQWLLKTCIY
uniref:Uncharacterized protein n=1 Tax=Arundo donax TaxID=35708 RepID=A0A0A8YHK4_ARUDO